MKVEEFKILETYERAEVCWGERTTQGLQKEFFAENYPGWEWNDFVPRLLKKKILVYQSEDPSFIKLRQGLYISGEIEFVEFAPGKNGIEVSCRLYSAI